MIPNPVPLILQEAPRPGLLAWIAGLARAGLVRVVFPLDAILTGMVAAGICLDGLCAFLGLTRDGLFAHIVRLGLPTPSDKPMRRPSARSWSVEDTQKLIALRASGVHPDVIADALSRKPSANAVRSKCRRLGVATPPRKQLFRPSMEQLALSFPTPVAPHSSPAAPSSQSGRDASPNVPVAPSPAKRQPSAEAARPGPASCRPQLQPLLPNFPVVLARREQEVVPTRFEQVDWSDLLWMGRLSGRRGNRAPGSQSHRTNEAAVGVTGVLTASGVPREIAAELTGLSVASFRTLRTRCGFPAIEGRSSKTEVFDLEVALETIERANLVIVKSMSADDGRPPKFFWRVAADRHVRLAPGERPAKRRGEAGGSPNRIAIITRAILDAETRNCGRIPMPGPTIILDRAAQSSPPLSFKSPQAARRGAAVSAIPLPTSAAFATPDARLGA